MTASDRDSQQDAGATVSHLPPSFRMAQVSAIAVAMVLVIGSGLAYRALQRRAEGDRPTPHLLPGTLASLPFEIDGWVGADEPLDKRVADATDTDDYVSRIYRAGDAQVGLFFAYGTRFRDLLPHRPEVCYPAAGWVLQQQHFETLVTPDGRHIPVRIHRFQGGPVDAVSVTVLSYHIVDGEIVADVGQLRKRGFALHKRVDYVAQVQIRCVGSVSADSAVDVVKRFAVASVGPIHDILTRDTTHPNPTGTAGDD